MATFCLNFIGRALLRHHARVDTSNNTIRQVEVSLRTTSTCGPRIIPATPFIDAELHHLQDTYTHIICKKCFCVRFPQSSGRAHKRWMHFDNAIECLNQNETMLVIQISSAKSVALERYTHLLNLSRNYNTASTSHLFTLYLKQAQQYREDFCKSISGTLEQLASLVREKIRLLELVNTRYQNQKVLCFLRIRYYYEEACQYSPQLIPYVIEDEDLAYLLKNNSYIRYNVLLEQAYKRLEECIDLLSWLHQADAETSGQGCEQNNIINYAFGSAPQGGSAVFFANDPWSESAQDTACVCGMREEAADVVTASEICDLSGANTSGGINLTD